MTRLRVDPANRQATGAPPQVRAERASCSEQNDVSIAPVITEGGKILRLTSGLDPNRKWTRAALSTTS